VRVGGIWRRKGENGKVEEAKEVRWAGRLAFFSLSRADRRRHTESKKTTNDRGDRTKVGCKST